MQAQTHPNVLAEELNPCLREMVEHSVDYDEQRMMGAVNHPDIKSVRVFRKKRKSNNKAAKQSRRRNR